MKIREFLQKLQNQPEHIKKLILWSVVIIIGLGLLIWWVNSLKIRLKSFQKEEFIEELKLPKFQEELKEMPKIEMPELEIPEISEEELKELEEMMKEAQE